MPNIGWLATAAFCVVLGFHSDVQKPIYRAVKFDEKGQLIIELASGSNVKPPKLPSQIAFEDARISPDGEIVGWLADYPFPGATKADPISGTLVLYRAGHIIQDFRTGQVFWSWKFADAHKVAYCTGPTHGRGRMRPKGYRLQADSGTVVSGRRQCKPSSMGTGPELLSR